LKSGRTSAGWSLAPTAILLGVAAGVALFGALVAFINLLVTLESPAQRGPLVALFGTVVFFVALGVGGYIELWRVLRRADHARVEADKVRQTLLRQLNARGADLERATHEAERAGRARAIFLSHVSEALTAPLDRLIEQAKSLTPADPIPAATLAQINQCADTLRKQFRLLLDAARIESGQINLFIERELPVRDLLQPVIESAHRTLEANPNLTLTAQIEDTLRLDADRTHLCRVVELLLMHTIRCTDAGAITLATRAEGETLLLTVQSGAARVVRDHPDFDLSVARALTTALGGQLLTENTTGVVHRVTFPARGGVRA
jgi:signal transduction histidine kinase